MFGLPRTHHRPKNVRLDTLVRLRWLAVFGPVAAVLVVHFGLEFDVPLWPCLAVIALAALLNVALRVGFPHTQWLEPERAAYLLGFDIAELAALLYLTGGLGNPFSFLLLRPAFDLGDGAAAAHDVAARCVRRLVRDGADLFSLSASMGKRRAIAASGNLRGRGLALHPARARIYRGLYVAGSRRSPSALGCACGDGTRAGARAASLAARWPGGRRGA